MLNGSYDDFFHSSSKNSLRKPRARCRLVETEKLTKYHEMSIILTNFTSLVVYSFKIDISCVKNSCNNPENHVKLSLGEAKNKSSLHKF